MAGTAAGSRKIAAKLKEKYGVDENGKSLFHTTIGHQGGQNSPGGYFRTLQNADPAKLKDIAKSGGAASANRKRAHETSNPRGTSKQVEQS